MNDPEQPLHTLDGQANAGSSPTERDPVVTASMTDIKARRLLIAAAIREDDPAARVTVASVVKVFHDDIAQARSNGTSWDRIAATLSVHAIAATADAVRIAFGRISPPRKPHPGVRSPVTTDRLPIADQPPSVERARPNPPTGSPASDHRPNITKRIR